MQDTQQTTVETTTGSAADAHAGEKDAANGHKGEEHKGTKINLKAPVLEVLKSSKSDVQTLQEKAELRKLRFQTGTAVNTTQAAEVASHNETHLILFQLAEQEKLKKKERLKKFGLPDPDEMEEKKKERMKKFGIQAPVKKVVFVKVSL